MSRFTHGSESNTSNRQEAHKTNDLAREAVGWNFHERMQSLLTRETVARDGFSETRCWAAIAV
jgi:hypothetical protein